jgi:hypothetical protein
MSTKPDLNDDTLKRLGLDPHGANTVGQNEPHRILSDNHWDQFQPKRSAHLMEGIDDFRKDALEKLARSFPFPLRDVVRLYRHVGERLDDVINIVTQTGAKTRQPDAIAELVRKSEEVNVAAELQAVAGQPTNSEALQIDVKAADTGLVHIDMNVPAQYIILAPQAAQEVAVALIDAILATSGRKLDNLPEIIDALLEVGKK